MFRRRSWNRKIRSVQEGEAESLDGLKQEVCGQINQVLRENPYEMLRTQKEVEGNLRFKRDLRRAFKNCATGDYDAKVLVCDFMKEILVTKLRVTEEKLDRVFHFREPYLLTARDKFSILIYEYEKYYKKQALYKFMETHGLARKRGNAEGEDWYEVTEQDIEEAYQKENYLMLSFVDKINIVAQRIFEDTKGNGPIDSLFYLKLDGISGGVSGNSLSQAGFRLEEGKMYSYQSIWIFFQGKSIYLSFLKFSSEREFVRICKNVYRYHEPGQLSQKKGYIVNEMADGSRVAVARPPFCESWVFFIRKFDSVFQKNIDELLIDSNKKYPIQLIKWMIKGCQVVAVTGEQGSGKTTLLMSMIRFIKPTYNLRVQELAFELHLRKIYPERNIVTFQETNTISGQEGLDFQKKTDGSVNILGEVASAGVCSWLIQMAQVASSFTLFTHHAKTTKSLVYSFRNALLMEGGFSDERIATEQVTHVINFDVHMKKAEDGHRYIERITEIIENETDYRGSIDQMFQVRDLLVYREGSYCICGIMSEQSQRRILDALGKEEKQNFLCFLHEWREQYEA